MNFSMRRIQDRESGDIIDIFLLILDPAVILAINRDQIINAFNLPRTYILSFKEALPLMKERRSYSEHDYGKTASYPECHFVLLNLAKISREALEESSEENFVLNLKNSIIDTLAHEVRHVIQINEGYNKRVFWRCASLFAPIVRWLDLEPWERDAEKFSQEAKKDERWKDWVQFCKIEGEFLKPVY